MRRRRRAVPLFVLAAALSGAALAVQTRFNGGLSEEIGDPYLTAALSFGTGTLLAGAALLLSRGGRSGIGRLWSVLRGGGLPAWALLGGVPGGAFILVQGMVAPTLGVALFTIGVVAGQAVGGLGLDAAGIGPGGRIPPSAPRLFGALLAVAAAVVVAGPGGASHIWLIALPALAGAGVALQTVMNGLTRSAAQSVSTSVFVSFCGGALVLGFVALVSVLLRGWPGDWPAGPWLYLGGGIGVVAGAAAAALVRPLGVLLLGVSVVAGQLVGSVMLDALHPFDRGPAPATIAGCALALAAVALVGVARERRRETA